MPSTEVEDLFYPSSASVRQLLIDHVGGFAIPSYQRPYRWPPADVKRLFEDLINGLERLVDDSRSVTFIGAIITVTGVSDNHRVRPREAREVIDGQQRLVTLLMLAAALHERLTEVDQALGDLTQQVETSEQDVVEWLSEQVSEVRGQLLACLFETRTVGDDGYRMLPKIVREMADIWSNRRSTARYISPAAHFLHRYIHAATNEEQFVLSSPETIIQPEPLGSSIDDHETLHSRFKQLRKLVRDIADGREGDIAERLDLTTLLQTQSSVLTGLFDLVPPELTDRVRELAADTSTQPAVRLLTVARFLLERVAITQINARDEAYAFDLFDSLNTTGEPLTALETFVPMVVAAEGQDSYPFSESYKHMAATSRLLAEVEKNIQRDTAVLVTSSLLADCGLKVPSRHNDQRRELKRRYDLASDVEEKRAMTQQLADSSLTYLGLWKKLSIPSELLPGPGLMLHSDAAFALRFANAINHTIVLAPLSRYLAALRANPAGLGEENVQAAIRAMVAFSVLWRAAHGGTDGIDAEYRRLMQEGRQDVMLPLSRTPRDRHDANPLPPIREFVRALWEVARDGTPGFATGQEWIHLVHARPIYEEQPQLARFLLLVSGHHAIPDPNTGLTADGAIAEHTDMLKPERWDDKRLSTLEHVAPQTPRTSNDEHPWDPDIYREAGIIHRLGNLTLIPLDDNQVLSNRSWREKRYIYRALAADGPDSTAAVLDEAIEREVELSPEFRSTIIDRRRHLPLLQAVAQYPNEWTAEHIEQRSKHLLNRCWNVLSSWLQVEAST